MTENDQDFRNRLLSLMGKVSYSLKDRDFFIKTDIGNFIWINPSLNGGSTMLMTDMTLEQWVDKKGVNAVRDKGYHLISKYCGDQFVIE